MVGPMTQTHELGPMLRLTALAAAATIACMLAIGFATGVAQEPMQRIAPVEDYVRFLSSRPGTFRLVVGLDNLFIAFYSAHFVLVYMWVVRHGAPRALAGLALGALLATAALDLVENMHYLVLSRRLQTSELLAHAQVLESWLKFHVSYVALFAFGMVFPRRTVLERAVAATLMWVQLPLGVLIYVSEPSLARPLVIARGCFFVVGLLANAIIFGQSSAARTSATASAP